MYFKGKKAVFFDFGDTLASTSPPYIKRINMAMRRAGYEVSYEEFEKAYLEADYDIFKIYEKQGKLTPEEYRSNFRSLLYEALGVDEDPSVFYTKIREEMKEIKFSRAVLEGTFDLLESLKKKGILIGIISNNDGKTEEKCEEVGIKSYIDYVFDSTELNLVKPDRRIFELALSNMGVSPKESIHIGDLYGSDVLGGLNAGLDVIWFNQRGGERFDGMEVCEVQSLIQIKEVLGN